MTFRDIQPYIAPVLQVVLTALAAWATRALVDWLSAHKANLESEVQSKTGIRDWQIDDTFETAVKAAEQYLKSSDGQAKKKWVTDYVQAYLKLHNVNMPVAEIEANIEAAVWTEINQNRAVQAPPASGAIPQRAK